MTHVHVKGEDVHENPTGQNYLERIPNYAEMHDDSSSFYRRRKYCGEAVIKLLPVQ